MSTRGAPDSWLGASGEWGLTKHKHRELCDELSDHMSEMARVESHGSAQDAKDTLATPKVRRKLAGVHLADQVYATLNRLPNRKEWFELAALGLWYVLIVVSDLAALGAESAAAEFSYGGMVAGDHYLELQRLYQPIGWSAWLLQGIARGGFFASFFYSLWGAWRIGAGVCLARILQLKLIHTLLVIGAFLVIGNRIWESWFNPNLIKTDAPLWLTAPVVLGTALALAVVVLVFSKGRRWVVSLGLVLAGLFLYPSSPALVEQIKTSSPLAVEVITLDCGQKLWKPSTDLELIAERAEMYRESYGRKMVDEADNRLFFDNLVVVGSPGTYWQISPWAKGYSGG